VLVGFPAFPGVFMVAVDEPHVVPPAAPVGELVLHFAPGVQAPGWPGPLGLGVARAARVPKADSMATTIAEAITATRIYCIITVYCSVLYK
jgi:hypothetical protein